MTNIPNGENCPPSLIVWRDDEIIFTHYGSWLHPLFALERYLEENRIPPEGLFLQDKIVGRAAAFLITGMGIQRVKALTLSTPGKTVFDQAGIDYEYDTLVERILCRTEELLADIDEIPAARQKIDELFQSPR